MSNATTPDPIAVNLYLEANELDEGFETPEGLVRYHDRYAGSVSLDTAEEDEQLRAFSTAADSDGGGGVPRTIIDSVDPDALQSALGLFGHLSGEDWFRTSNLDGLVRAARELPDRSTIARLARATALYGGQDSEKWAIIYSAVVQIARDAARASDDTATNVAVPVLEMVPSLSEDRWAGAVRSIEPLLGELRTVAEDSANPSNLRDRCDAHAGDGYSLAYGRVDHPRTEPPEKEVVYGWIQSTIRLLETAHGLSDEAQRFARPIVDVPGPEGVRQALQYAQNQATAGQTDGSDTEPSDDDAKSPPGDKGKRKARFVAGASLLAAGVGFASNAIKVGEWIAEHTPSWLIDAWNAIVELVQQVPHP